MSTENVASATPVHDIVICDGDTGRTAADAAIERLTAWVRDYGDSKPRAFVRDVSMLLVVAKAAIASRDTLDAVAQTGSDVLMALRNEEFAKLNGGVERINDLHLEAIRAWEQHCDDGEN